MEQAVLLHVSIFESLWNRGELTRLVAAIACNLARDEDIARAVRSACRYVEAAIRTSPNLGKGSGPLNHFHSIQVLPFAS